MTQRQIKMRFNPNEPEELDKIITGSYDDFVRMERRNLLLVSSVTLFSYLANIKPTEAKFLGFSFDNFNESNFFLILLTLTIYFLFAYTIYAIPSFRFSLKSWNSAKGKAMGIAGDKHRFSIEFKNIASSGRFLLWVFINYILPILAGIIASVFAILKI